MLHHKIAVVAAFSVLLFLPYYALAQDTYDHKKLLADPYRAFHTFTQKHNKKYNSQTEFEHRFNVFYENLYAIDKLNKMHSDTEFRVNQFADLSPGEFKKQRLMRCSSTYSLDPQEELRKKRAANLSTSDLPTEFDWRGKGPVTSVKDQGTVGTCWAFSTTGNLEGQWYLSHKEKVNLSVEQLTECDARDCGVFGGWPWHAYEYIKSTGGIETEESYPYCAGTGDCFPCMAPGTNYTFCGPGPTYCRKNCTTDSSQFKVSVKDWFSVAPDADQISARLIKNGPLSICLNAGALQFYHHGIWNPPNWLCNPADIDHCVLLVGYGVHKGLFGKEEPYWLVKNSWGEKWGESGYFRIAKGKGKCGVNTCVTSGMVTPPTQNK